MTAKSFNLCLAAMLALLLLSSTEFPGAMIGFFCGIAVAFFVAGPTFLLAAALGVDGRLILHALIGCYILLLLVLLLMAARSWRSDSPEVARLLSFKAAIFLMLPAVAYLSTQALARAWP